MVACGWHMRWTALTLCDVQGAWLLLSDIHIEAAKFDLAQPTLKLVLQHNKVCGCYRRF